MLTPPTKKTTTKKTKALEPLEKPWDLDAPLLDIVHIHIAYMQTTTWHVPPTQCTGVV